MFTARISSDYRIFVAKNQHKFRAILFLIIAVLNVIGTIILIPSMGITGAALATCIAYFIGPIILMNWYYSKKANIDVKGFWNNIIRICPSSIVLMIGGIIATQSITISSWIVLLCAIGVYSLLYFVLNWQFSMNKYEKELVLLPIKKFKTR